MSDQQTASMETGGMQRIENSNEKDWPIKAGFWGSLIWLGLLGAYISNTTGWANIPNVSMDTMGGFLEGAFAPLAFLWFVLGYFTQQKELSQNTEAIKLQYQEMQKTSAQAVIQSEAIKASEMHARRESFLSVAESVRGQLGGIMGFLMLSSQSANESGDVPPQKMTRLWDQIGRNDYEVFTRQMLSLTFNHGERYAYKLLFGTEVRTKHTENFMFTFERLINSASECDTNGMIRDAIEGGAHGFLYKRIVNIKENPPEGFTLGVYDFDPDTIDQSADRLAYSQLMSLEGNRLQGLYCQATNYINPQVRKWLLRTFYTLRSILRVQTTQKKNVNCLKRYC